MHNLPSTPISKSEPHTPLSASCDTTSIITNKERANESEQIGDSVNQKFVLAPTPAQLRQKSSKNQKQMVSMESSVNCSLQVSPTIGQSMITTLANIPTSLPSSLPTPTSASAIDESPQTQGQSLLSPTTGKKSLLKKPQKAADNDK